MTEQDLLEAIRQARSVVGPTEAMTALEIQEATGMGINQVRAKLKVLVAEGKVMVTWVYRDTLTTTLTGRQARVPGYVAVMGHGEIMVTGEHSVAG